MTLIIGGAGQGKLTYALSQLHLNGDGVSRDPEVPAPIVAGLEEWLRNCSEPWPVLERLLLENPNVTILCREVGCGVSPMNGNDRIWRERVGRVCCELAKRASHVIRVCCGLPMILKGGAEWN